MLEGSDDLSLPMNLQSKYQTSYNHALYEAWTSYLHVPNVGTTFSFFGDYFMIANSIIDVANIELIILSHMLVPLK